MLWIFVVHETIVGGTERLLDVIDGIYCFIHDSYAVSTVVSIMQEYYHTLVAGSMGNRTFWTDLQTTISRKLEIFCRPTATLKLLKLEVT